MSTLSEFQDHLKKFRADKPKTNFMLISFGYDKKFVLPYEQGITIIEALGKAEKYEESYSNGDSVHPVPQDELVFHIINHTKYERMKVCGLMGITLKALEQAEANAKAAQQTQTETP